MIPKMRHWRQEELSIIEGVLEGKPYAALDELTLWIRSRIIKRMLAEDHDAGLREGVKHGRGYIQGEDIPGAERVGGDASV